MSFTKKEITFKGRPVFEKIRMQSFERIPKLYVENEACFMYVKEGSFAVRMPEEQKDFSEGQGFLAKCFDYFFEMSPKDLSQHDYIEVVGVLLFPDVVEEIFQIDFSNIEPATDYNLRKIAIDQLLENFMKSIEILLDNPSLVDDELVKTKLKEFVLLLLRTEQGKSIEVFFANLFQKTQSDFKITVVENLYSSLSLGEMAQLCGMSESTFKRRFKETFDESPIKFINQKKLEKAAFLLGSPSQRVSDIAYDCGFTNISSFNRAFKTKYGKSPSEYRD